MTNRACSTWLAGRLAKCPTNTKNAHSLVVSPLSSQAEQACFDIREQDRLFLNSPSDVMSVIIPAFG